MHALEENGVFYSVKGGCQVVEAGIDRVPFTSDFGDHLLAGKNGFCTRDPFLVGGLSELRDVSVRQSWQNPVQKDILEGFR